MTTEQKYRTCSRCNEDKPASAPGWVYNVCPECAGETAMPALRKCARCKLHVPYWSGKSPVCRPCAATAAREYRARRKANGTPPQPPRLKTCKLCETEQLYPSPVWTTGIPYCKPCTNRAARERRQGKELPPLPSHPLHNMPSIKCRICGKYKGHTAKNFPSRQHPKICKTCQTKANNASKKRLRAREAWVVCRTCKELVWHEAGGRGWSNNRCPTCSRVAENARYHTIIKPDAERMERRRKAQREAYKDTKG